MSVLLATGCICYENVSVGRCVPRPRDVSILQTAIRFSMWGWGEAPHSTFHILLLAKWLKSSFRHCRCSLSLRLPLNGCFGQTESRPRGGKQTELSGLWRLGRSGMNKQHVQWETKTPRSLTQPSSLGCQLLLGSLEVSLKVMTQMKCSFTAFGVALVDARL